jgi:hypothetical protein
MKENIIQLQIKQGYNLQDIKFRLRYFLGENLVSKLNLKQSNDNFLLQLNTDNKDAILGVIQHLPCIQIN